MEKCQKTFKKCEKMQHKEWDDIHVNVCIEHCTQPRIEGCLFAYVLWSAENYPLMVCSKHNAYRREL